MSMLLKNFVWHEVVMVVKVPEVVKVQIVVHEDINLLFKCKKISTYYLAKKRNSKENKNLQGFGRLEYYDYTKRPAF